MKGRDIKQNNIKFFSKYLMSFLMSSSSTKLAYPKNKNFYKKEKVAKKNTRRFKKPIDFQKVIRSRPNNVHWKIRV